MNKKILNTALMLTPKKLQCKAVSKALNFLFPLASLSFDGTKILKLEVPDLNRLWYIKLNSNGYQATSSNQTADITVSASFSTIISAQDCDHLYSSLSTGRIQVSANSQDRLRIEAALRSLDQKTLDALVERCYAFFKIKPKPRFDIKTVTIADIRTARDVDWIRDEAVKLELSNVREALRLMELAHQKRPNGVLICRKLAEYRSKLGYTIL